MFRKPTKKDLAAQKIVDEILDIVERFGRFVSTDKRKKRLMLDGGVLKPNGEIIKPYELMVQSVQPLLQKAVDNGE